MILESDMLAAFDSLPKRFYFGGSSARLSMDEVVGTGDVVFKYDVFKTTILEYKFTRKDDLDSFKRSVKELREKIEEYNNLEGFEVATDQVDTANQNYSGVIIDVNYEVE